MWGIFFKASKKIFFLSGQALTPPSLSGRVTKKKYIFCGFPKYSLLLPAITIDDYNYLHHSRHYPALSFIHSHNRNYTAIICLAVK